MFGTSNENRGPSPHVINRGSNDAGVFWGCRRDLVERVAGSEQRRETWPGGSGWPSKPGDDRETRGFISMQMRRPSADARRTGVRAAGPTRWRDDPLGSSRIDWYCHSERLLRRHGDGVAVCSPRIEVLIEQTMITLSARRASLELESFQR